MAIRYFDSYGPKAMVQGPDGKLYVFYQGEPKRNPITDERVADYFSDHGDLFEITLDEQNVSQPVPKKVTRPMLSTDLKAPDAANDADKALLDALKSEDELPEKSPKKTKTDTSAG